MGRADDGVGNVGAFHVEHADFRAGDIELENQFVVFGNDVGIRDFEREGECLAADAGGEFQRDGHWFGGGFHLGAG